MSASFREPPMGAQRTSKECNSHSYGHEGANAPKTSAPAKAHTPLRGCTLLTFLQTSSLLSMGSTKPFCTWAMSNRREAEHRTTQAIPRAKFAVQEPAHLFQYVLLEPFLHSLQPHAANAMILLHVFERSHAFFQHIGVAYGK